jgi:acetolactate synthase I/II/III large subunit
MKLSDYVIQTIASIPIKHVFMIAGGGAMHLNNSVSDCEDITYVCNLHEQAAAIAAEAYAKITNQPGFVLVTTGPGGTNAITGVVGAWLDSTPLIVVSGQVKTTDLLKGLGVRQMGFQEVDIVSIVKPITKYAVTVTDPKSIRYHVEKALFYTKNNRPGPVWLDIPLDVQSMEIEPSTLVGFASDNLQSTEEFNGQLQNDVKQLVSMINKSKRPIIWAGNGIHLAGAEYSFRNIVNKLEIPILLTWLGMDLLPDDHPHFIGRPGSVAPRGANFAVQNSDLLITIGARLDMGSVGYSHRNLAREAKKVIIDIDSAEINKMKTKIHLSIQADAGDFLSELERQISAIQNIDRSNWKNQCLEWKTRYPVIQNEYYKKSQYVSTYIFTDRLANLLPEGQVVVSGSSGAGVEIFLLCYKVKKNQRVIHTASLGAMGFGLPASIGACLANKNNSVVLIDGDGGFQLNVHELEVIKRLNLPIKIFILNNQGYSSIRISQLRYFGKKTGADFDSGMTLPNMIKVVKAYGIPTFRITNNKSIDKQVAYVLNYPGPAYVDVMISPDEPRIPSISTVLLPDGRIVSRPMEDLAPFLSRAEFSSNMIIPPLDESLIGD